MFWFDIAFLAFNSLALFFQVQQVSPNQVLVVVHSFAMGVHFTSAIVHS